MILEPTAEWPLTELMSVAELERFAPDYRPGLSDDELDRMTVEDAQRIVGGMAAFAHRRRLVDQQAGLSGRSSFSKEVR